MGGHQHWPPHHDTNWYDPYPLPTGPAPTTFRSGGVLTTSHHPPPPSGGPCPGCQHLPWPMSAPNTDHYHTTRTVMTHGDYKPAPHPPPSDLGEYHPWPPTTTTTPPPPPLGAPKPTRSARCTTKRRISQSGSVFYTPKPLRRATARLWGPRYALFLIFRPYSRKEPKSSQRAFFTTCQKID
jgi:hypothetical protein